MYRFSVSSGYGFLKFVLTFDRTGHEQMSFANPEPPFYHIRTCMNGTVSF